MIDPKETTVVQTRDLPMTSLDEVKDHAAAARALFSWKAVGVLMDHGPQAVITVLLDDDVVAGASRFCLPAAHSVDALRAYNEGKSSPMELRCWQGHTMTSEQTQSLADLTEAWNKSSGQRTVQSDEDWWAFFEKFEKEDREGSRLRDHRRDTQPSPS